jgi:putative copper export protein
MRDMKLSLLHIAPAGEHNSPAIFLMWLALFVVALAVGASKRIQLKKRARKVRLRAFAQVPVDAEEAAESEILKQ